MGVDQIKGPPLALRPDRLRDEFISKLLDICGDVRFLWLAELGQTTTSTEKSRHGAVVTWSKDQQTWDDLTARLGSGYSQPFDGTDEEGDTPDVDRHSFGDGVSDSPFSTLMLTKPDAFAALMVLLSKENSVSVDEWRVEIDTSGFVSLFLDDASASANSRATFETSLGTDWVLISTTYDGAGLNTGIKIYVDGVNKTLTRGTSGAYTAMENTASLVRLGNRYSTPQDFYNGSSAFKLITGKELSADEQWVIKDLVNQFYDLAL